MRNIDRYGPISDVQTAKAGSNRQILAALSRVLAVVAGLFAVLPGPAEAQNAASSIGRVEKLSGSATAIRAGSRVDRLKKGAPIYSGDRVQTGPSSKLGIVFADRSVFSLLGNATMEINDLVYNPQGSGNSMGVDLVKGSFAFLTGQIAASGTMNVQTAYANLGIRGTQPWVTVGPIISYTIMTERDGTTGAYTLLSKDTRGAIATVNLATVGTTKKYVMTSPDDTPQLVDKAAGEGRIARQHNRIIASALRSAGSRAGRGRNPVNRNGRGDGDGDGGGGVGGDGDGGGHQ